MGRFPWQEPTRHLDCGTVDVNRPRLAGMVNPRHHQAQASLMGQRVGDGHKGRTA